MRAEIHGSSRTGPDERVHSGLIGVNNGPDRTRRNVRFSCGLPPPKGAHLIAGISILGLFAVEFGRDRLPFLPTGS